MKKLHIVLFLILSYMLIIACGSTKANNSQPVNESQSVADGSVINTEAIEPTKFSEPTNTIEMLPTATPENIISVEEQVVLDQDDIKITIKSLSFDGFFGPSLKLLIENNRSSNITVQVRNSSINDVMVEPMFSCDVASGKKANDEISFMSSDLKEANITTIKNIEFSFHIFDTDSWDTVLDSDLINLSTNADPNFVQTYDDSGFVSLNTNDIKIVVKKLDSEDSFWGTDIYLYIENNSASNITVQTRDMSVNGFMIEPLFSCDVSAGKKAYDKITFLESDLSENDIENITDLEFSFHIFNTDTWNTVIDSDNITVSFE